MGVTKACFQLECMADEMYNELNRTEAGNAMANAVLAQKMLGIESGPKLKPCFNWRNAAKTVVTEKLTSLDMGSLCIAKSTLFELLP